MPWITRALSLPAIACLCGPAAGQAFVCPVTAQPGTTQDRDQLIAGGVAALLSFAVEQTPFVGWQWTGGISLLDPAHTAQTVAVTGICGEALIRAPGWDLDPGPVVVPDPLRLSKVRGAVQLLLVLTVDEIQAAEWEFRRGLAFSWGLRFLRSALSEGGVLPGTEALVEARIHEYLAAMTEGLVTGMAKAPGWYYDSGADISKRGCFVTAPALISLAEAYNGGLAGEVYLPAMLSGLVYLQSAEVPVTGAYHYLGEHGWPLGGALEDAKSTPQGAAARTPSCELARYLWGDPATDLLGSLQDFYTYYDLLTDFDLGSPCSHSGPFQIGCQYLLYGHYHVALAVERLPAGSTRDAMRTCMTTMLGNLQVQGSHWVDTISTQAPATAMAVLALSAPLVVLDAPLAAVPAVTFRRGDTNHDGVVNVADSSVLLDYLFGGNGTTVLPLDAADSNDDGLVNVSDAIFLLNYLFVGGAPPPAPFPALGTDPTPDSL